MGFQRRANNSTVGCLRRILATHLGKDFNHDQADGHQVLLWFAVENWVEDVALTLPAGPQTAVSGLLSVALWSCKRRSTALMKLSPKGV
jgi:hypothetical protein